ncbi:MAG: lysophospholipid acyltransferase family protein [Chloroflexota bacterium]
MHILRGIWRVLLSFVAVGLVTVVVVMTAWIPVRIQDVRLGAWMVSKLAQFLARLFQVQFECPDAHKIRQHTGLIFPNHLSFFDAVLLMSVCPVRFVSMAELRSWPFIGWIAIAVGTVFVNRDNKASRQVAREQLAHQDSYFPAIVLFPEGHISDTGELMPFRYGAFEVAVSGGLPVMPCVFTYDPLPVVGWTDESLLTALWRVATYGGPIQSRLQVLRVVQPRPDDDAKQLALEMHGAMTAVLRYSGHEDDVLRPEL